MKKDNSKNITIPTYDTRLTRNNVVTLKVSEPGGPDRTAERWSLAERMSLIDP